MNCVRVLLFWLTLQHWRVSFSMLNVHYLEKKNIEFLLVIKNCDCSKTTNTSRGGFNPRLRCFLISILNNSGISPWNIFILLWHDSSSCHVISRKSTDWNKSFTVFRCYSISFLFEFSVPCQHNCETNRRCSHVSWNRRFITERVLK